jgi:hypothetical protein
LLYLKNELSSLVFHCFFSPWHTPAPSAGGKPIKCVNHVVSLTCKR